MSDQNWGPGQPIAESAAVRADAADAAAGLSTTDARLSVRKLDLAGVRVNPRRLCRSAPGRHPRDHRGGDRVLRIRSDHIRRRQRER